MVNSRRRCRQSASKQQHHAYPGFRPIWRASARSVAQFGDPYCQHSPAQGCKFAPTAYPRRGVRLNSSLLRTPRLSDSEGALDMRPTRVNTRARVSPQADGQVIHRSRHRPIAIDGYLLRPGRRVIGSACCEIYPGYGPDVRDEKNQVIRPRDSPNAHSISDCAPHHRHRFRPHALVHGHSAVGNHCHSPVRASVSSGRGSAESSSTGWELPSMKAPT